jgi:hypothetical protein
MTTTITTITTKQAHSGFQDVVIFENGKENYHNYHKNDCSPWQCGNCGNAKNEEIKLPHY